MRAQGLPELDAARGNEYGHFFMSLEAARQGQGVAIIPDILLASAASRDLIALTAFKVRSAGEYYLLSLNERSQERSILLFREWVQEQMHYASDFPSPD
jgi:LysR family glycine cleavage system transcriptional activator